MPCAVSQICSFYAGANHSRRNGRTFWSRTGIARGLIKGNYWAFYCKLSVSQGKSLFLVNHNEGMVISRAGIHPVDRHQNRFQHAPSDGQGLVGNDPAVSEAHKTLIDFKLYLCQN